LSCFGSKLNRKLQITEFERICHMRLSSVSLSLFFSIRLFGWLVTAL